MFTSSSHILCLPVPQVVHNSRTGPRHFWFHFDDLRWRTAVRFPSFVTVRAAKELFPVSPLHIPGEIFHIPSYMVIRQFFSLRYGKGVPSAIPEPVVVAVIFAVCRDIDHSLAGRPPQKKHEPRQTFSVA
jgi:hypothetical protein